MKDRVKEKLDRIDELYPPERIARSKERIERVWNGEKPADRYPFVYQPRYIDAFCIPPMPDAYEEYLRFNLDDIIARGNTKDDFIPGFISGCNQAAMPGLFGAKEIITEEGIHSNVRILQNAEDIDSLPEPCIKPGTPAYNVLTMQEYVLEQTQGRLPIHVFDMQGPMDFTAQMFGYDNLFLCALEDPDRYDRLMSMTTEGFIMFWKRQMELSGDLLMKTHLYPYNWVPDSAGVSASVDSLVMVSPKFYDDFFKPYLVRIGETFGGLTVHTCGAVAPIAKNISFTPFIKGVNSGMSIFELFAAGISRDIVMIRDGYKIEDAERIFNFVKENSLRPQLTFDFFPVHIPGQWDETDRKNMLRLEEIILNAAKV